MYWARQTENLQLCSVGLAYTLCSLLIWRHQFLAGIINLPEMNADGMQIKIKQEYHIICANSRESVAEKNPGELAYTLPG
jgi:hypothetical protein